MGSFTDRSKFLSGVANAAFALARTGRTHRDVFLVLDGFGHRGRAWREADEAGRDRETLIRDLIEDQYENPVRIVAFNTAEGWCRDVTVDIATSCADGRLSVMFAPFMGPTDDLCDRKHIRGQTWQNRQ